ncbi:MAG TPA: zf-TFIIB domain-containing protein [Kofleriaceae bacterium]
MSAYRIAGSTACPDCGVPLRAYGARFVCDDCTGIFIGVDDLRRAVAEMGGGELEVVAATGKPGAACPSCTRPMDSYRLDVRDHPKAFRGRYFSLLGTNLVRAEAIDRDTTFPGCPAHGLWFAQGLLAGVFARINAKLSVGRGGVRAVGERGLRISQRKYKHRAVAPYASPFAGRMLPCPSCHDPLAQHGDHWSCERCGGAFVETPALEAMISEMTLAPYELPAAELEPGDTSCPVCGSATGSRVLAGSDVAQCPPHGVWFGPAKLSAVLAAMAPATRPSWLVRWFRRRS